MFTAPSARPRKGTKRSLLALAFALAAACQVTPAFAQTSPPAPQPGTPVWLEDFSTGTPTASLAGPGPAIALSAYHTDASNPLGSWIYYSDPSWTPTANECNGWILNSNSTIPPNAQDAGCGIIAGETKNGTDQNAWFFLKAMADVLGAERGLAPGKNNVLASMTNRSDNGLNPGTDAIQLRANSVTEVTEGHYYIASAYFAAVHCHSENTSWTDPLEFLTLTVSGAAVSSALGVDPCTAGEARDVGAGNTEVIVHVAQVDSSAWLAPTGATEVGLQVSNTIRQTVGNDQAIDLLQIIDVTPQLSESFDEADVPVNGTTTLTFTITNTTDYLAKPGWSFDETLPPGLTIVGTPTTTCPSGNITSTGPTSFNVEGDLEAGAANSSCTVSVEVTSTAPGTFINDPNAPTTLDNVTALPGLLNPPALARVRFAGADMVAAEVSPPTPSSPGSSDMTVVTSCINDGPLDAANPTCDVTVTGGTNQNTTCTPSPLPASLTVGSSITCTTTYTQGTGPVTIETDAGSGTFDPNGGNNQNLIRQPAPFSSTPTAAVPTGEALPWLLLLLLTATGWFALARRNNRR